VGNAAIIIFVFTLNPLWFYVGGALVTPALLVGLFWLVRREGVGGSAQRLVLTAIVIVMPMIGIRLLLDWALSRPWAQLVALCTTFVYLAVVVSAMRELRARRRARA